ncbi:MAG TPA: AraC family transcriptional regulator [Planctomycetota bacterium]|nr:AraC family transcriptional regulator [Planctomycetota bacterium]
MRNISRRRYAVGSHAFALPDDFPFIAFAHEQVDQPIARLHVHNVLELGYCLEGHGVFVVGDKVMPFHAGCATVINDREPHLAQSARGTTSRWLFALVDPQRLRTHSAAERALLDPSDLCGSGFVNVLDPRRHAVTCALIREALEELTGAARGARFAAIGLTQAIMARLHRLPGRDGSDGGRRRAAAARVAPALGYIAAHHREAVTVPRLARLCGLSVPSFHRVFALAFAQSPKQYLLRFRVSTAADALLRSSCSVLDAALDAGFGSASAFNRQFRAVLGVSPREWRRAADGETGAHRSRSTRRRPP